MSKTDTTGEGKAVFIIDELDRCRPDFSLGIIECLKHFFDSDNLHFVLVANKDFLSSSVASRYGISNGSETYLDKFFDFSIVFEEAANFRGSSNAEIYTQKILSDLIGKVDNKSQELIETISEIVAAYDLTFRQVEKISTNAALAYYAFKDNEFRPPYLIAFLCFLKAIHPKIYQSIKLKRFNFEEFRPIVAHGKWDHYSVRERIESVFLYYSDNDINEDDPRFAGFASMSARFHFRDRQSILPYLANSVVDRFS